MTARLTVLIPTLPARAALLDRACMWYGRADIPVEIICRQRPYLENAMDLLDRAMSPYVAIASDDDLISPRALRSSVDFLETHADYTVCWGEDFLFGIDAERRQPWGRIDWVAPVRGYSHEEDWYIARVRGFMDRYSGSGLAVHRTEILKTAYRAAWHNYRYFETMDNGCFDLIGEWIVTVLPVRYGKLKRLPMLYSMRQQYSSPDGRGLRALIRRRCADQFRWAQRRLRMNPYWKDFEAMREFVEGGPYDS